MGDLVLREDRDGAAVLTLFAQLRERHGPDMAERIAAFTGERS